MSRIAFHRSFIATAAAVCVCLCVVVGASATSADRQATPHKGGTLRVATVYDVLGFDPFAVTAQSNLMSRAIYEPLIELTAKLQPIPMLATKWKFNADQTQVTLRLRQGVTFQSGAAFNAAAVVANFKRARDPAIGLNMVAVTAPVKSVSTDGKYAVRITFNDPIAQPAAFDVLQSVAMVDPAMNTPAALRNQASGTGPFKLVSWTPGQTVKLEANRSWWGGKKNGAPYLDGIVITPYTDPSAAVAALQSGGADLLWDFDATRAPSLKSSGFGIGTAPLSSLNMEVRIVSTKAPFTNGPYRRAMNFAIDRDAIVKAARGGFGTPILTPWASHNLALETRLLKNTYKYNPQKVVGVIKQQGIQNPDFTLIVATTQPDSIVAAQIIQASLKSVGVDVKLELLDGATYVRRVVAGDFQAAMAYETSGAHYPPLITLNSSWRIVNAPLWGGATPPKPYVDAIVAAQGAKTAAAQAKAVDRARGAALVMSDPVVISSRPPVFATAKGVNGFTTTKVDSFPYYALTWLG